MRNKVKKIILLLGDIACLYGSLWLMLFIRYGQVEPMTFIRHLRVFSVFFIIWLMIFYISGLYDFIYCRIRLNYLVNFVKILIINLFVCISFFYVVPYLVNKDIIAPKRNILLYFLIFFILNLIWRHLYYFLMRMRVLVNNIAIVGVTNKIPEIIDRLTTFSTHDYKLGLIIGDVKDELAMPGVEIIRNIPELINLKELLTIRNIKTIIVDDYVKMDKELVEKLYQCLPLQIDFIKFSKLYENLTGKIPTQIIEKVWFLSNLKEAKKKKYEQFKKLADYLFALLLGIIFLAIFPFVAVIIKITSPGPIFYKQKRVGRSGKIFELVKFRSMLNQAEKNGAQWSNDHDNRVTKIGKFLRHSHFDELPQAINIFKGEMSMVGPRPERPEFVEKLNKEIPYYQVRHIVKPGITGWAQINFKYGSSEKDALEKLQYDIYYIKNRSLILDFSIFLKTINKIIKQI